MSDSPDDLNPLTTIPEPTTLHISQRRLSSYHRLQQMRDHFWMQWSKEYLAELQQFQKWNKPDGPGLAPGQLVIVRDDNILPHQWELGRIDEVFPGSNGVARVASGKTKEGLRRRGFPKLFLCQSEMFFNFLFLVIPLLQMLSS